MVNIVIVGVGALGKRHLSSILESGLEKQIYCVDINEHALDEFENRDEVFLYNNISDIPCHQVDFALLAMSAKGRRQMYEELVEHATVKNIVFEKVLFQTVEDYYWVKHDIEKRGINAWVNCARRQMDSYQDLRETLADAKYMEVHITGGEWGLACNSIHMLDIIAFLSQDDKVRVDKMNLDNEIKDSKRQGYKEVNGVMEGSGTRLKEFSISSVANINFPIEINITTDKARYCILEAQKKIIEKQHNGQEVEQDFEMPYQSQMTQHVMEDILKTGTCRLTKYNESMKLHLQIIEPMIKFFEESGMEEGKCPIT